MNTFDKIRAFCIPFRIVLGLSALGAGFFYTADDQFYNTWFLLGLAPLTAGILKFCPICLITKKCSVI